MEAVPASAPTQPEAPAPSTISATRDAANRNDFSAFQEADTAARKGTPLEKVEAPAVEEAAPANPGNVAAPPVERAISKRQQDINDKIRVSTENATADLRREVEQLRAQLSRPAPVAPQAPTKPAEPVATPQEEWERIAAMPNAPKLANFDSVESHAAAMSVFAFRTLQTEQANQHAQHTEQTQLSEAQAARVNTFSTRLQEAAAADPTYATKLTPEVRALKPFGALEKGEASGPRNVIAEQVYDSPVAPQVLLHLSEHPEALTALETMPAAIAALPPSLRTRAHLQHIVKEFAKLEGRFETPPVAAGAVAPVVPSPISAAPPPPPTVHRPSTSSDPKASALARGDVSTYLELDRQERASKRRSA